jgi:hypothetical protein
LPLTTLGRAQPGRAPNVGGALRRSSAEPQAPKVTKKQAIKGAAWVGVLAACTKRVFNKCTPNAQRARRGHGKLHNLLIITDFK